MTTAVAAPLDPLTLPLSGERLIEASAGTGKTFTIAALYLRLLLGLGEATPAPLSVEQILVVTFTEAATEELRSRIRDNIHALRVACIRGQSDHPLFAALLEQIADKRAAARVLLAAEQRMDEAAIYTIHAFCQRILTMAAYQSGVLFNLTLTEDESPLLRRACLDFWRRHCYPLTLPVARAVRREWAGPEQLLETLRPWLQGTTPAMPSAARAPSLTAYFEQLCAEVATLKQQWRTHRQALEAELRQADLNRNAYNASRLQGWLQAVDAWAAQETEDFALSDKLDKFGQATLIAKTRKGGRPPRHAVFVAIDSALAATPSLRHWVIPQALQAIRDTVEQEKQRRAEIGFDDLLLRLDRALQGPSGEALAAQIRARYPAALIDEFQDTDPQQYRIFRTLYYQQPGCCWLLIGDPKQAIYAFRGADIFTYMAARREIAAHYTLATNWRSAEPLVNSVNRLFSNLDSPFLFAQIPFQPVQAARQNAALRFVCNQQSQPALRIWYAETGLSQAEYQQKMAAQCARQISDWLAASQKEDAWLCQGETRTLLQASDITVLVRNRQEAQLMQDALRARYIASVFLSGRESVFGAPEAKELLWLLQAMLNPGEAPLLRRALATSLIGMNTGQLDALRQDEAQWEALTEEFYAYRQRWKRYGILPALREISVRRQIAERLLAEAQGERRLTDFLHLSELLQEAALSQESEHGLVRWLIQQINAPDQQAKKQQMRLESDRHVVQIVTIHKAKGLQYPVVCLPFIAGFRQQARGLYHDRDDFRPVLDLAVTPQTRELEEEERLAEDMRLLYVALTRAVWHCCLGVAPIYAKGRKTDGLSDLHQSALGWLIQRGQPCDDSGFRQALQTLAGPDIALSPLSAAGPGHFYHPPASEETLQARQVSRQHRDLWRVTSYSALQQQHASLAEELLPRLDWTASTPAALTVAAQAYTPHTFPRGARAGTFLHGLLENLDFTAPPDRDWLAQQLNSYGPGEAWLPMLEAWLKTILSVPLGEAGVCLQQIPAERRLVELAFWLPAQGVVDGRQWDACIRRYDPLSADCPPLDFRQFNGMLKGFIDLVFCWQDRYYILDYKSNWLGEDARAYTQEAMKQAMKGHRYDLQYQLYSVAVHRYLAQRLKQYDYERYFGGVIYLFLRGVTAGDARQGIFFHRPQAALISALDALLQGKGNAHNGKGGIPTG